MKLDEETTCESGTECRSDFSKLLADATVEEEASEKEYEKISQENRVSTAMKDADVKYMTKEVASLEKSVSEMTSDIQAEQTELDAVLDYYEKLKSPRLICVSS